MSDAPTETEPPAEPPRALTLAPESPVSDEGLARAILAIEKIWKRVGKRAPDAIRVHVEALLASAGAIVAGSETPVAERLRIARALDDALAEVHGRPPWTPHFYGPGELAFIKIWETVKIQGSIDKARAEAIYERYYRRAEEAYQRMLWFFERCGIDVSEEKKKPAWDEAYASLDTGREILWGRVRR
jgi:hypothetical protein